MQKKSNPIWKLTTRYILANKKRNAAILAAIVMAVFMFTSTISVGMSATKTIEIHNLRINGAAAHTALTYPSQENLQQIINSQNINTYGFRYNIGKVFNTHLVHESDVHLDIQMVYCDEIVVDEIFSPAWTDIEGRQPQAANEIMASRELLTHLGITEPQIGMSISLEYAIDGELNHTVADLNLSGLYTNYDWIGGGKERLLFVYSEFAPLDNPYIVYFTEIEQGLFISNFTIQPKSEQSIKSTEGGSLTTENIAIGAFIIFFLFIASYLLVYNVLNIAVAQDVRFYGLLKAIGASAGQISLIVYGQVFLLAAAAIPIGLILGTITPFVLLPVLLNDATTIVSFSPIIYVVGAVLALLAVLMGASAPAQKAHGIPPVSAVNYAGEIKVSIKARFLTRGRPFRLAVRNIFRERKRAAVMILSLSLSVFVFTFISILLNSMDMYRYANKHSPLIEGDFVISAIMDRVDHIPRQFIDSIRQLPGVEHVHPTLYTDAVMEKQPDLEPYINEIAESLRSVGATENEIAYFTEERIGFTLVGIDVERIRDLYEDFPWDIQAFARGEFALVLSDTPSKLVQAQSLNARLVEGHNETEGFPGFEDFNFPFTITIAGQLPMNPKRTDDATIDDEQIELIYSFLLVSSEYLSQLVTSFGLNPPLVSSLVIKSDNAYDESLFRTLRQMVAVLPDNDFTRLHSQAGVRLMFASAQRQIDSIGIAISLILGLAGVQNFISSLSASVVIRKKEFAVMQSTGMNRTQLFLMLIYEGLIYVVSTLFIGIAFGTGTFALLYHYIDFLREELTLAFSFPVFRVGLITGLIIMVCVLISVITCYLAMLESVVERLREGV